MEEQEKEIEEQEQEQEQPKEDVNKIIDDIKASYDSKLNDVKLSYEKRLKERDDIIKSLLNDDNKKQEVNSIVDAINKRRQKQRL